MDRLLFTPFRYPPLRRGSRFGTRFERGIFHASQHPEAALAERAYYILLFLEGTTADLASLEIPLTVFRVAFGTARAVDLTSDPFAEFAGTIASRTSYSATQPLGREMRGAGVEAFLYPSARDPEGRTNVGAWWASAARSSSWGAACPRPPCDPVANGVGYTVVD